MKKKIFSRGAEAVIYSDGVNITKERISKKYRLPEIDRKIIKRRTKSETKILEKASKIISAPKPEKIKEFNKIIMPFIEGERLSDKLNSYNKLKQKKVMFNIGKSIAKIHKEGIIHGDLTTSNMILKDNEVHLFDFGLGSLNGKYEQKGVDIHLLKQALESRHFQNWEFLFKNFEEGYESINKPEAKKVFERLKVIEKRGRYKH